MALFKRLGKIRIGLLALLIPLVVAAAPDSDTIIIRQISNLGFKSEEKIHSTDRYLFYNQIKFNNKNAHLLFQQMKEIKFSYSPTSCLAGTVEVIWVGKTTNTQKGCLSGETERKLIAKLQEIRSLAIKQGSSK